VAANAKVENVSPEQLKKLWSKISAGDWFQLLNEYKPGHNWVQRGGKISGRCIYHAEKTPSFHVDPVSGFAHCFGGSCPTKHVWNPVRLAADIMGIGYAQAIRQLKSRFGVVLPSAYANNVQKIEENDDLKRVLRTVMNRELCDALVDPEDPKFAYLEATKLIGWFRERGLPEDVIHQLPIGVIPTHERLYDRLDELPNGKEYREAAHTYLRDCFTTPGNPMKYEGFLAFFYYKSPTEIGRIRIRKPGTPKVYALDDPYEQQVGFFGLNMYPELMNALDNHALHIIEGEFDALSIIAHQLANGRSDVCAVGTGGTMMESHVDELSTFGFVKKYLIPDNDRPGIEWARTILSENKDVNRVFTWDDDLDQQIKDVDQAIRVYGFDDFYDRLTDESSYQFNHEWANAQVTKRMALIPPGDLEEHNKLVIEFGKALSKDSEREAFIAYVTEEFGMSREVIVQHIAPDDTPEGFKYRVAKRLQEEYYFLSDDISGGTSMLVIAWSRRKRVVRKFPMDAEKKIRAALQCDIGLLEDYTKKHFGIPDFIQYKLGPKGQLVERSDMDISKMLTHYYSHAFTVASKNIEPAERLVQLGQGVHYIDNPDENERVIYVVNGTHFFRGVFSQDGEEVTYENIDCPRFENYIFNLNNAPWSVNIKTVKDLEEASSQCDPVEVYQKVKKILDIGWKFYNHELESMFLAADTMYTTVADLFKTVVMADVTGVTHSGKTTLLQIIGGHEFPGYRLCEATETLSDFSAAGMRNLMSGHKLRLFIDEFEDNDFGVGRPSRKSAAVREILDIIRNMSSGGADSVRGDTSGGFLRFKLQFPLTVSGIYTMQEARDLNRFVHIRTQRIDGFTNPIVPIQKAFSIKDMQKLRRQLTLCWFSRIPELLKAFEEVKNDFAGGANLPAGMYSRMTDNFLPAATILKLVGEDHVKFVQKFSELKMQELVEQGGAAKESAEIWSEVLHASIALHQLTQEVDETVVGLAKLLSDPHKHYILDKIDLGVYFLPEKMWLIVFWKKAVTGVLRNSTKFRNVQHHGHLKVIADTDPRVIPKEQLARGSFLQKEIWPRVNATIGLNEISVFNLEGTLVIKEDSEPALRDSQRRERMLGDIPQATLPKTNKGNFDV